MFSDRATTTKARLPRRPPAFARNALAGAHVLVLGLGASGKAAARLALACGATCHGLDAGTGESLAERAAELRRLGATVDLDWPPGKGLPAADLIVISPGIAIGSAMGQQACSTRAPVISELEFGSRFCSCPLLAVTGTNGKTTTVELTTHLLSAAGLRVRSAGNIGLPLSACAAESDQLDALVVEVSSFQLEAIDRFRPAAAALLNVTPDHYDRHGGPAPYLAAKLALFRNMPDASTMVFRHDLVAAPGIRELLRERTGAPLLFSPEPRAGCALFREAGTLCERQADGAVRHLLDVDELALLGEHNVENALAALALARLAGQCPAQAALALPTFQPSAHRLELVAEIDGVRFVNDSKATNVDAMCRALETVAATCQGPPVLLIAGGVDKDIDFSMALPKLEKHVRRAFLIGTCKGRLVKEWHDVVSCSEFLTLADAVSAAASLAIPGDVVLLSPGCASQDMFRNYAHRGNEFRALVERRARE